MKVKFIIRLTMGYSSQRKAIAQKLERDNGLSYDPANEIIATVGANEAVFMTMMALLNPGDEVLIPDPCWPHYFYCAVMAGAIPVSVPLKAEKGFIPQIEDFQSRLSSKTRMLIINSPNNPTGVVYTTDVLEPLAELAKANSLFVVSDEVYEKIVYCGERHMSIASFPKMKKRTLTINGLSKTYSMTGWRLGYIATEKSLADALIRVHQYTTVCATTFAQWGAVEALNGSQDEVETMVKEFDRRRKLVVCALKDMPGISVVEPKGAFYVFPKVKALGKTAEELSWFLLDEARIAVVPGTTMGNYGTDYIRISYATSYENLEKAMDRMSTALKKLHS